MVSHLNMVSPQNGVTRGRPPAPLATLLVLVRGPKAVLYRVFVAYRCVYTGWFTGLMRLDPTGVRKPR